ncbi:MAG: hypothetical protein HAW58_02635, partial [Candidatus Thioglobus sp.]|nr:hypothetical protein [Candidatus Thioglobus sp.]
MQYLQKMRLLLSRKDKKNLILLVIFSIIMALIESVGISAVMPFIHVATDFSVIQSNDYYIPDYICPNRTDSTTRATKKKIVEWVLSPILRVNLRSKLPLT